MPLSKLTLLAAGLALAFSTSGLTTRAYAQSAQAQPQNYPGDMMSDVGQDEMIYLEAETGRLSKANKKLSDETHAKATQAGARALAEGALIYRKGGRVYLLENKPGSGGKTMVEEHFGDHFKKGHQY